MALKLVHCSPRSGGRRLAPVSDRECALGLVPPVHIPQEAGVELGHRRKLEELKEPTISFQRRRLTALENVHGEQNSHREYRTAAFLFCFSPLLRKSFSRGKLGYILIKRELKNPSFSK